MLVIDLSGTIAKLVWNLIKVKISLTGANHYVTVFKSHHVHLDI